jgi:hypothetical protein
LAIGGGGESRGESAPAEIFASVAFIGGQPKICYIFEFSGKLTLSIFHRFLLV